MMSSFCVVLNTHFFWSSMGSTAAAVPTGASSGTPASATKGRMARVLGEPGRADNGVDVILADQLAHGRNGLRGVAGIVQHDVLDVQVADARRQQRHGVLLRDTD